MELDIRSIWKKRGIACGDKECERTFNACYKKSRKHWREFHHEEYLCCKVLNFPVLGKEKNRHWNFWHHSKVDHLPVNGTNPTYPPPGDRLMSFAPMIPARDMYRKEVYNLTWQQEKCWSALQFSRDQKVVPQERGAVIITGRLWGNCCRKTVEEYRP